MRKIDMNRIEELIGTATLLSKLIKALTIQSDFILWIDQKHPKILKEWEKHCNSK